MHQGRDPSLQSKSDNYKRQPGKCTQPLPTRTRSMSHNVTGVGQLLQSSIAFEAKPKKAT